MNSEKMSMKKVQSRIKSRCLQKNLSLESKQEISEKIMSLKKINSEKNEIREKIKITPKRGLGKNVSQESKSCTLKKFYP